MDDSNSIIDILVNEYDALRIHRDNRTQIKDKKDGHVASGLDREQKQQHTKHAGS
ncbi:hypothetical protein KIN20_028472 [Parelaphostrongylus tenuis]|uniref:Uncharacterized protein n=1 Tax=Parelaphostrongylus tenuis TaxID=148309 RepID=A0AAD5R176_PARTN|nr:hypothetical protein KIN20_028472 [Parelaphostrongylus tenuis]